MVYLSRRSILEKFPWAKEKSLFDKIDIDQELDDSIKWVLNEKQLQLVVMLFKELEEWFISRNREIDIKIYYIGELLDRLQIDFSSNTREVGLIIDKYKRFSVDLLDEEDGDYDVIF
ncbi:hypothetical protein P8610_18060 [Fictibacillus sp. UD]|uniref:hypothetical protein n=1 Tax=Fictibacillus sp. UD TaxID=3038777 RepID=UPI0037451452